MKKHFLSIIDYDSDFPMTSLGPSLYFAPFSRRRRPFWYRGKGWYQHFHFGAVELIYMGLTPAFRFFLHRSPEIMCISGLIFPREKTGRWTWWVPHWFRHLDIPGQRNGDGDHEKAHNRSQCTYDLPGKHKDDFEGTLRDTFWRLKDICRYMMWVWYASWIWNRDGMGWGMGTICRNIFTCKKMCCIKYIQKLYHIVI